MISRQAPINKQPSWLRTLLALPLGALLIVQMAACLPVLGLLLTHPALGVGSALLVQSSSAAVISRWMLRQRRWWLPLHMFFMPGIVLMLQLGVHPGWYLLALTVCVLLFGGAWRGHVPFFISSSHALRALDDILPRDTYLHFVDVGCGSGVVLRTVKRLRPGWQVSGVEAAWLPWLWARLHLAISTPQARVYRGNFWRMPLGDADVVYAYLSPTPMLALLRKLEQDKGTHYLISYRFPIPGLEPEQVVDASDGSCLYRWDLRKVSHGN